MSRTTDSSRSGSGSEAPPPPPLSDLATKLETKLKKQDTANKDVFARKLKEEEVRHFHPMADIIAQRLLSPKLLSEVRPIFHDFMLLRLSLRRMDKMLAAVERQNRRINKAVTRRRKMARSYVQQVAPSSPTSASTSSAPSASGPQPVALSARQTRFLKLKLEQVSQLEARLSAFIGSHPADTLSRPFKQYLQWQMGELANARKKIDGYGKDRGTQSDGGKVSKASDSPFSVTPTSAGTNSGNSSIKSSKTDKTKRNFPKKTSTSKKISQNGAGLQPTGLQPTGLSPTGTGSDSGVEVDPPGAHHQGRGTPPNGRKSTSSSRRRRGQLNGASGSPQTTGAPNPQAAPVLNRKVIPNANQQTPPRTTRTPNDNGYVSDIGGSPIAETSPDPNHKVKDENKAARKGGRNKGGTSQAEKNKTGHGTQPDQGH